MAKTKPKPIPVPVKPAAAAAPAPAVAPRKGFLDYFPYLLFAFAVLLYFNTLQNGYVMDDGAFITDHVTVQEGMKGIPDLLTHGSVYGSTRENSGIYRPLTVVMFAVEHALFGNSAGKQHFVHILLYGLCCVVLYKALRQLLHGRPDLPKFSPALAVVTALLFAAHPVHTEVAANIKSRDEILSFLGCFAALYFLLRAIDLGQQKACWWSYGCFALALLAKENAVAFVGVIPLALYLARPMNVRSALLLSWPYAVLAAAYLLLREAVLEDPQYAMPVINNTLVAAQNIGERYATIFYILLQYLRLLVFPHPLTWEYGYNQVPVKTWADAAVLVSAGLHLGLLGYGLFLLAKRRLGALPLLYYFGTLALTLNIFVLIGATMAERFLFMPSVAYCAGLAWLQVKAVQWGPDGLKAGRLAVPVLGILLLYSYRTISRNRDWESNLTLFKAGTEISPNSYRANVAFASNSLTIGEKETDEARKQQYYRDAATYYPRALAIYPKKADDWYNLGVVYSYLNEKEKMLHAYQQALVHSPKYFKAAYNLGTIYQLDKDYAQALKYFLIAQEADPSFGDVNFKVGLNYHYQNQLPEAIRNYELHLQRNPGNRDAITNLMIANQTLGNQERANYYAQQLQQLR